MGKFKAGKWFLRGLFVYGLGCTVSSVINRGWKKTCIDEPRDAGKKIGSGCKKLYNQVVGSRKTTTDNSSVLSSVIEETTTTVNNHQYNANNGGGNWGGNRRNGENRYNNRVNNL